MKIMITLLLLFSSIILGGCGTNPNVSISSSTEEMSESIAATETQSKATIIPEVTITDTPTMEQTIAPTVTPAINAGAALQNVVKDLDSNGVDDNVQIISLDTTGAKTCMQVYLNGEKIFIYEEPNVRMMGIGTFEYLDLDEDNINEIFITADTNANCRPYSVVLCMKQTEGKWNRMEYPTNEGGCFEFPFKITRGKKEFDFMISSKDTNQVIHYDASQYFEDDESGNSYSVQNYRKHNFKEGDEVGFISAWGIWEAKTGTYDGRNGIVALQGIEGPYGHGLGEINIYFAYDKNGKVDILNVEYLPE